MHYEKLENGNLVISAITKDEQKVIDAIEAYKATFTDTQVQIPENTI